MRYQPKKWFPPKSRRARELADRRRGKKGTTEVSIEILKQCYPNGGPEMRRPPWAETARKFGWLTAAAYWELAPVPTGRMTRNRFPESMYRQFPLLPKSTAARQSMSNPSWQARFPGGKW